MKRRCHRHRIRQWRSSCTNWNELNWPVTSQPSYTTRSLVTRVSVSTRLAAAKLGRLVLSQFWTHAFQCGCSHGSSVQFMCRERAFMVSHHSLGASSDCAPHLPKTVYYSASLLLLLLNLLINWPLRKRCALTFDWAGVHITQAGDERAKGVFSPNFRVEK